MPWRRPSSTTLPANQGSSSRLPRIRVVPHRRRMVRRHRAHLREGFINDVRPQAHSFGETDGYGFALRPLIEGQEIGIVAPLSERQSGQRIEPAEGYQQDE